MNSYTYKWFDLVAKAVPGFQLSLVRSIQRLETWKESDSMSARIVLGYDDQCEIVLVAQNVVWVNPLRPASDPGVLPYSPYGVGEFVIADIEDGGVVIADELSDLNIRAGSVMVEHVNPLNGESGAA